MFLLIRETDGMDGRIFTGDDFGAHDFTRIVEPCYHTLSIAYNGISVNMKAANA